MLTFACASCPGSIEARMLLSRYSRVPFCLFFSFFRRDRYVSAPELPLLPGAVPSSDCAMTASVSCSCPSWLFLSFNPLYPPSASAASSPKTTIPRHLRSTRYISVDIFISLSAVSVFIPSLLSVVPRHTDFPSLLLPSGIRGFFFALRGISCSRKQPLPPQSRKYCKKETSPSH